MDRQRAGPVRAGLVADRETVSMRKERSKLLEILQKLERLVASSVADQSVETMDTEDDERVEISVE